jgi:sarcosine oxidase subunit beta
MALDLPKSADIVVIGGGVMGASTAYHLALAGAKEVCLLERESHFGLGATGRCAGGVRYQFATEVNVRLSIESLAMLSRFQQETGQDCGYRKCGYLFVLTRPKDMETFQANVAMQRRLGVETQWLTGDEVRKMLPMMNFDDALAATYGPKDGLADPNSVVSGYIKRARQLGAQVLTDIEVQGILTDAGRVSGVQTNQGSLMCAAIVNAAGPWAGRIAEMAEIDLPITPLRRQIVTTTRLPELPKDFPFVIDFAQSLYFHREGEGVLTGMSNPNEKPGFDQTVDPDWELIAMEAAIERMPMLEKAGRLSGWAGLYEITPDAHPVMGPTPLDGFWVVAGFSGHGFMHGPIAGKIMAEFILEGDATTVDVSALDYARFTEGRLIHEYNVV